MGELSLKGVFTRENNRVFVFGRRFKLGDFGGVFSLGLLDGLQADLETSLNGIDVGLNPDKRGGVAIGAEKLLDFFAVLLGIELSLDDEVLAGFSNEVKNLEHLGTVETEVALDVS